MRRRWGGVKGGDPYLRICGGRGAMWGVDVRYLGGNAESFYTGGSDSTVRIWYGEAMERGQSDVIVLKSKVRGVGRR